MEQVIINKNSLKKNKSIKLAQKKAKKYYGDKLFAKKNNEPKAKLRKLVDITDIPFVNIIDGLKDISTCQNAKEKIELITKDDVIRACQNVNLTGCSGNGFETVKKLNGFKTENGVLLINGVECDPGLVHDAWIYRNCFDMVELGAILLRKTLHLKDIVLATKEPLNSQAHAFEQVKVKDRFPMGYEKNLIKTVLGVTIDKNEYPSDKGILVLNIQTVLTIAEMMLSTEKDNFINTRYITVADIESGKAVVTRVPLGMKAKEVINKALPQIDGANKKLYMGGGALSCHSLSEDECVTGQTNFIACGDMPDYQSAGKCKGCGGCTMNCPAGVKVSKIVQYIDKNGKNNPEECAKFSPDMCISCGACTFVCHAGKDTRALVAWAKGDK